MASSVFKVGKTCRLIFNNAYFRKALHFPEIEIFSKRCIHNSSPCLGITELLMPSLSPTMEEGNIVKWYKKEGDKVAPGDVLCDIQTDKAVVSMDTEEEGILAKILMPENSKEIKIGSLIGLLVEEGDDWQNVDIPASKTMSSSSTPSSSTSMTSKPTATEPGSKKSNFMGPSVKKLLEEYGIKAAEVPHTGPHGALVKSDVITYVEAKNLSKVQFDTDFKESTAPSQTYSVETTEEEPYIDIPHTSMRKTIAKRLTESKSTIPHSYSSINCRVGAVTELRKELSEQGIKCSMNDFIIKAAALSLQRAPRLNTVWKDGTAHISPTVDISVAVATDNGLITPIVKNAADLPIDEISNVVKELAGRARQGKLKLNEFQGGSFSISNLGMFGISEFTAVINPPQSAILAIGTSRLTVGPDGQPTPEMTVTLSFDSRVIDEFDAAEFLEIFTSIIETPAIMIGKSQIAYRGFF